MSLELKKSYFAFFMITLFWGITFPLIRMSVQVLTPAQFVFLRFGSAFLLMIPFVIKRGLTSKEVGEPLLFVKAFDLGVLTWICYQAQTIGLQTVESGRAAFITGTSVVMIPMMSPLFGLGMPKRMDFMAALGALAGLYLLTDPIAQQMSGGDFWMILCAFIYATYLHCLQRWVRHGADALLMTFFQILGVTFCSCLLNWHAGDVFPTLNREIVIAIGICALFSTVLATLLQTNFQSRLTPEKAALIFSLESVFASIFGYWILGEVLTVRGLVGCVVIFGAIVGSELFKAREKKL